MKFKKIMSVMAGFVLVGATLGMASAFPTPYVQDGIDDYAIVYGSNAAQSDLIASQSINDYLSTLTSSSQASSSSNEDNLITGDFSDSLGVSENEITLGTNIADNGRLKYVLTDNQISPLIDSEINWDDGENIKTTFNVHEEILLGNMNLITTESMFNDALSTYFLGGQCTGVSNLGAALFRSNGVPAKQLIVNSDKKSKLTQAIIHYMCEYYCPDYGWVRADSRFNFAGTPLAYNESVVLKVIYPEDENVAGSGIEGNGGLVPWVWMTNDNIIRGKTREWCWNEGIVPVTENVANDTLELTRNVWELFIQYNGKNLNVQDQQYFNNAIFAQQNAINCFKLLDYNGFFDNITIAYNEYLKIDYP